MSSCFLDAAQTLLRSNQPTQTCYSFPSSPPLYEEKFGGCAAKKPPNLESHSNANYERVWFAQKESFTLSLISYTSTCKAAAHHYNWLHKLFSHVKMKRIDFYKQT